MKNRFGRRGLSPLIATVLLIAFAAALGTLVMSWAIPSGGQQDMCEQVIVELDPSLNANPICYAQQSREIRFAIRNTGTITIHTVLLRAIDADNNRVERDVPADLSPQRAGTFNLAYETSNPNEIGVTLTPILSSGVACPRTEIQRLRVPLC